MTTKPTLYFMLLSAPVRSVLMTAKQIELELDLKEINLLTGEQLSDDFIKINPQHTLPTLVDGDFILWDSHAICTYLISKYGKDDSLYPEDLKKRARIDQRLHFDSSVLFQIGHDTVVKIAMEGYEITDTDYTKMFDVFKLLEKFLETDLFLVDDTMTVADLSCIPMILLLSQFCPIVETKYPKLSDYMSRMAELPYYDQINVQGNNLLMDFVNKKIEENKNKN